MDLHRYTFEEIANIVGGLMQGASPSADWRLNKILVDSRKVSDPDGSLFVAIVGERNDGHAYIKDLINQGVRHFLIMHWDEKWASLPASFILVKDTMVALQMLAAAHRMRFDIPVIGITGSNGKTVVKEWLFQLLGSDKNIVRSPKSYNSQVGVPLSIWQMQVEYELGIFEAGISLPGEMKKLQKMIQPTIGIFTNAGQAHAENFPDQQQKISEKMLLFESVNKLIWCKDYAAITAAIKDANIDDEKLFSWSRKSNATLVISKVSKPARHQDGDTSEGITRIQGIYKHDFIDIAIPFSDEASIENAIHCWALMLLLGYDQDHIAQRMLLLNPVAMRLELKEGINNCSVINDSYNSDLGSLAIALDFMSQQKQNARKTVILSDILQSGKNDEALYREVATMLEGKGVGKLIGIGKAICANQHLFVGEKSFFETTEDFIRNYPSFSFKDETILLKGARMFGFEAISKTLQQKAHQTILEINLNALIHNLNFYRSRLKPETKIMGMVKAYSYGSGSFEIANVLQFHRVDYLVVAYADEGMELRRRGITLPIMVMNPEEQSFDTIINHSLEPEIYSFRILSQFTEAVKRSLRVRPNLVVPIHLKLDTGMHRLGFEEQEISELVARIKNNRSLRVASVFSHLAASDESAQDEFTRNQADMFNRIADEICSQFLYPVLRHMLNSAGIIRFPEYQMDMVRLGIGLYGIAPSSHEQKQLQNVGTLRTTISQIRSVTAGETVGYSRTGKAIRNTTVATIAIGYADGIPRSLGNGKGKVLVNGMFAATIGNVCMDMMMINITDIPAREGDEVILFGSEYPVYQFASDADMIPYEVLTGISQRVKRIYFFE